MIEEWVCSMVTMEYVWFLVSFLGESMMGSSSSDEEEKKENQVLQSFVQYSLDGYCPVGQGVVGVDDQWAVHRFHSSVVSRRNDWSYSGASATVARPPFHPLFRCFPLPRFLVDWIVTKSVLVYVSMLTVIEDRNDQKAERKRWIGAGHPRVVLGHDRDESSAIDEYVCSMVTIEYVWERVSFLGDVEETSLCRRMV